VRWLLAASLAAVVLAPAAAADEAPAAATGSQAAVAAADGDGANPEAATAAGDDARRAQAARRSTGDAAAPSSPPPQAVIYDRVSVVGRSDGMIKIPGSAHVIGKVEIERYEHDDVQRLLRQVPGINIQEEEGFGLRPNIGIRGTGVERSQKVLLLEDGVPIAPAPYSAPAAYYSPSAGRMEAIEVRKGSSSIRQGPLTTGGAINYVSSSIPDRLGGTVDVAGGEDGTVKLKANAGATYEHFAFLVETYRLENDGFKHLDGGGDTGFELQDYLLKLRLQSGDDARVYQALELKAGHTEQDADETYLGLTRADFDRDPYRRYRASQEDRLVTDHDQVQLRYFVRPRADLDVVTTLYRNDFFRNWRKNERVLGVRNNLVLDQPELFATELAILRGDADSPDDALTVRNNRRDYYSEGIQSAVTWQLRGARTLHQLQFGFRWHRDAEDRFQEDDLFAMRGGRLVLTSPGAPGSQSNRIAEAEALAFFVQDEISFGRWTLTPGIRFESIDLMRTDYGRDDPRRQGPTSVRRNEVDVAIPGLGLTYRLSPEHYVFASVHRGFSPPSPSSREPVDAEDSISYEVGTRWGRGSSQAEAVFFFSDYDNLVGTDTLSSGGGGTGDQFNGGAVEVLGLELSYVTDLYRRGDAHLPLRLAYTYTRSEFLTSFTTSFADWAPAVERGDELPYVPAHQLYAELGFETDRWGAFVSANFVDEMRTRAGSGPIVEPHRIEEHLVFDLAASYRLLDRYRFYLQVRNLLDDAYVVARRPYGLRPGLPRTVLAGISFGF